MKRMLAFVTAVVLTVVAPGLLLGQSDLIIGTWKLNLTKSKYNTVQPPKSETETAEAQGDGSTKISYEGVAADGSQFAFSFATKFDGKDSPVSGVGPNGQDAIAVKRIDANTTTGTSKKAGKVVATTRSVISKDGKVMTLTSKGVDANGKPRNVVLVWDKQ
jgi:hypothetical protein